MEEKKTISFIILTASDCCFSGLDEDESGGGVELKRLIEETKLFGAAKVNANVTVPDEVSRIRASVVYFSDVVEVNVLLITGGTALAPGDVNAEPLSEWMEREVAGLSHSVLRDGFAQTPNAASSGAIAGVRNKTLIVSLPGSVDASVEGLKSIATVLPNAVNLIITCQNNEVALTHGEKIENNPKPKSKVSLEITEKNRGRNSMNASGMPDLFQKFVSALDIVKMPTVDALGYVSAKNVVSLENITQHLTSVIVGQVVILANELLTQTALGAIAAIGQKDVSVFRKPVVAILSCRHEPWEPLKEKEVRDSNKIVLKSLISSWGYEVIDLGIAPDEPDDVLNALQMGFASADVVITTGDMSMDQRDIIKDVLYQDLGMNIHFDRLEMKPGESTGFGTLNTPDQNSKYWFGLPGDPVAAFVSAHLVVSPVLKMLSGWRSNIFPKKITAKTGHSISNTDSYMVEYQRGSLSYSNIDGSILEVPVVSTTGYLNQSNSSIFGCINASCLLEIPARKYYGLFDKIIVLLLE